MQKTRKRRLVVESLEARCLLDGTGLTALPGAAARESVIISLQDDFANPRAFGQGFVAQHGGQLGHVYEHALKGFSAQLPPAAIEALQRNPAVKSVEADLIMQTTAQVVPFGISRIGATPGVAPDINASNVNIAIIDSGIDGSHPDLNVAGGQRFFTVNSGPPRSRGSFQDDNWNDDNGHGTHVAGTAAALDNNIGVVGVAPGANLWAVKVLDSNGSGFLSDVMKGIDWVTSTRTDGNPYNDIHVANMSLSGTGVSTAYRTAIQNSVAEGVVYVVAAGNNGRDIHGSDKTFGTSDDTIPAAYPEVATISAFGDSDGMAGGVGGNTSWGADDTFANFSNFSNSDELKNDAFLQDNIQFLGADRHNLGLGIDLVLPGVNIFSTARGGGYVTMSGTSMAAPHAAGLAARHIAVHGPATDAEGVYAIRQALIDSGKRWRDEDYGLQLVLNDQGGNTDSPDKYEENIGWVASSTVIVAPTVTITAPASGTVVEGSVTIRAAANAFENDVELVEFFVNSELIGSGNFDSQSADWSISWATMDGETVLYADGTYELTAVVTDSAQLTGSHSVTVLLDNIDDPPHVEILSPAAGATLSGTVELSALATDDREVTGVTFSVNGESIGPVTESNGIWSASWTTSDVPDGAYTIQAVATDSGGNTATESITVNVNNSVASMSAHLTGSATSVNRNFWRANVTVTIHANDANLAGAVVTGQWSNTSETVSGTTAQNGQISFSTGNLSRSGVSSIGFTVLSVVRDGYDYSPADPDSITVLANGSIAGLANSPAQSASTPAPNDNRAAEPDEPERVAYVVDYLMANVTHWPAAARDAAVPVLRPLQGEQDVFQEDLETLLAEPLSISW